MSIVDELNLDPGDLREFTPRRRRPAADYSDAAVEHRKHLPPPPIAWQDAGQYAANEYPPALPEWVETFRAPNALFDLDKHEVQVTYAVDGWIQAGKVGALVAAGGTGKTTLLLILAVCIATGRPFFGCQVKQGVFVLLSNDDSQDDLVGALARVVRAMHLTEAELALVAFKVRIQSLQGLDGTKTFAEPVPGGVAPTDLPQLILEAVSGIEDLVGIALDTLRQFSGGNSNDEQVVKLAVAGATDIATKTGAFVILPHHTGKQNFRDGIADMYCGSGSAAIADNCRFVLLLQTTTWADIEAKVQRTGQEAGDPLVLTSTRGSLLVKAPEPMFLCRDGFRIERVAGAVLTKDQQADERDREVLRAVRGGAQTKNAIYEVVRGKKAAVMQRIADLEARGLLTGGSPTGSRSPSLLVVTAAGAKLLDTSL